MNNCFEHIYALEGSPFSGKTTLLNFILKQYPKEFSVIPETGEYVGGDKNFPDIPFENFEKAKANIHFFLELEIMRCRDALTLFKKNNRPVILDRSTAISSPIFYELLEEKHSDYHGFKDSFFKYALDIFSKAIEAGEIFIPRGIIYLKPQDFDTFTERLPRGAKNLVFTNFESFEYLDKKYADLISSSYLTENILRLTSNNSELSLLENCLKIKEFTSKPLREGFRSDVLNNFTGIKRLLNRELNLEHEQSKYTDAARKASDLVEHAILSKSLFNNK